MAINKEEEEEKIKDVGAGLVSVWFFIFTQIYLQYIGC
jgi:hypothetical protein